MRSDEPAHVEHCIGGRPRCTDARAGSIVRRADQQRRTNEEYWQVYFDTNRAIRETFATAGYPAPEQLVAGAERVRLPTREEE